MKVLHVTPYFYGAWAYGGIPRLSFHLAAAQARQGCEVEAVTTDVIDRDHRRAGGDYEAEGVKVRVLPNLSNRLAYDAQFFTPRGILRARREVSRFDVVHVHGHRNLLNSLFALAAADAGIPTVMMPNGTLVNIERRQLAKKIYDAILGGRQVKRTDGFIAVSRAEMKDMAALGVPGKKIRVIPNGVFMEDDAGGVQFKKKFGIRGDYLLYLGKITPRKGVEHAVEALSLAGDKSLVLVIAGNDMGHAAEVRRRADELGVTSRVIFTGLVTGVDKAAAYREALYTIYAGKDEIFGLVPWESILCGTVPIVADDSGCGEWIAEGRAGHVVPYGDPAAIAAVIGRRDESAEREMARRGAEFCRKRLSWDVIAQDVIKYYGEIVR